MAVENADKTIAELPTIDSIHESDTIPVWDVSASENKTKKVPVGMIEDKIKQASELKVTELWKGNYYKASKGSIVLSDSINDYKMLIVTGKMYYQGTNKGEQVISITIPRELYYYASQYDASSGNNEFMLNGTISGTTRRITFGFDPSYPKTLFTAVMEGSSSHEPRLIGVYGVN